MTTPQLENVEDIYPLTPMQEGMLFHTVASPGTGVFVDQICIEVHGPITPDLARRAWDLLIERHQTLRTAFVWDGLDEPLQVVRQTVTPEWTDLDWRDRSDEERSAELDARLDAERARGFDLSDAPLLRFTLIREREDRALLVWTFHHLIIDGWSAHVLLSQFEHLARTLEAGASPSAERPFRYRDFVAWRAQATGDSEGYWRERLAGFDAPLRLEAPTRPAQPAGVDAGRPHRTSSASLSRQTSDAIRQMASEAGVTLNTAILGAWMLVISRWTRESDVVVGVTSSGRPPELTGIERAVGLFINTLPCRSSIPTDASVTEWLRTLQTGQLRDRDHEQVALASVQRWSDVAPGQPLFESLFVFENYPPRTEADDSGIRIGSLRFLEQSNYPLAVLALPGEEIELSIVSEAARYDARWIDTLLGAMAAVIDQFAAAPDGRLSDIALREAPPADAPSLDGWTPGGSIHSAIQSVAAATPDAPAVIASDGTLSYRDLEERANGLAHALDAAGVGPGALVGVLTPRTSAMLVGILGVLKAGAAYVPLDPTYPSEHIQRLLTDEGIAVVVAPVGADVPEGPAVVRIEQDERAPTPPERTVGGPDPAYVIHTSGSTGRPKGVVITHDNLCHATIARHAYYRDPVGRFLLLSSFAFDSSVAGIFWSLTTGGAIVLPGEGDDRDVDALGRLIRSHNVTHLLGLPALYEMLLDEASDSLGSLRVAIVAGEACDPRVARAHERVVPQCQLHNEYGPTEGTVWCAVHRVTPSDLERVPIGRATPGTTLRVVDSVMRPVPSGMPGELCVAGPQVARGYLNRPDLTGERFGSLPDGVPAYRTGDLVVERADGRLEFLGRVDRQLKVRGHRIETDAVESLIREALPSGEVAVVARPDRAGGAVRLLAYIAAPGADLDALRTTLKARLPDFTVPDRIIPVDEIPLRPNGKIDHAALPDPTDRTDATPHAEPRTEPERALASLWAELLGVDRVGIHDDYFALGGDSILSIRMVSRARQLGLEIQTAQVAEHPTVAELAAVAGDAATNRIDQGPVSGEVPLGVIQRWFFGLDLAEPSWWNLSNVFEMPEELSTDTLRVALDACLEQHNMLRVRFERTGDGWHQFVEQHAPIEIREVDESTDDLDAALREAEALVDPERGRCLCATVIQRTGAPRLLVLSVHHLVIDVVSWQILMDDLELALAQQRRGEPAVLPDKTISYGRWVESVTDAAPSSAGPVPDAPALPIDLPGGTIGTEQDARVHRATVDEALTARLLTEANDAYRTRPEELLLSAIGMALAEWTGDAPPLVALESHGREGPALDVSRTVGWFSVTAPLKIPAVVGADVGEFIRTTKEARRAIVDGGVADHARRWIHGDHAGAEPQILFNFLGRVSTGQQGGVLRWVSGNEANARAGVNRRVTPIEVVASVRQGVLSVQWWFSESLHRPETIERVAASFERALASIVAHCTDGTSGGFTPSDFPDADLDQDELDSFLDTLG